MYSNRKKLGTTASIRPLTDLPGKKDVSYAFKPEAELFTSLSEGRVHAIDNNLPFRYRRYHVLDFVHSCSDLSHFAIFAHGWRNGIQLGFTLKHARRLAKALAGAAYDDTLVVTLYCCSTAQGGLGGDGGFADVLRDSLCKYGITRCRVDGHTTRGHTTRNPHLRRFEGLGSPYGGAGGQYIVHPKSRSMFWRWRRALTTSFRFEFPLMSTEHILRTLNDDL